MERRLNIIVIGGGISGLAFALKASIYADIHLIVKDDLYISNSYQAKGGIAAPFAYNDSTVTHIQDTLAAGEGLCDSKAVSFMIKNAKQSIIDLVLAGVEFSLDSNRQLDLSREGGHRYNRIVHTKDETGKQVIEKLVEQVRSNDHIHIYENHFALDLIVKNGICEGAHILDEERHTCYTLLSDFVILATGGAGQLYTLNTNPKSATGDGFALAHRAGAKISNMEFIQFHPTMLYLKNRNENILISEALRGAGAELKRLDGTPFMNQYHPMGSLAPRDIVTRAMTKEMQLEKVEYLYLDARAIEKEKLESEFPYIINICKKYNIDIFTQMIPVAPAAHYICGGVNTDLRGATNIPQLFAIGEVACTGVHGANRLASNSLLEGLVFANSAANYLRTSKPKKNSETLIYDTIAQSNDSNAITFDLLELQKLMWENVGVVRHKKRLNEALHQLHQWETELLQSKYFDAPSRSSYELLNMLQTAILIAQGALDRSKSIGTHCMEDDAIELGLTTKTVNHALAYFP